MWFCLQQIAVIHRSFKLQKITRLQDHNEITVNPSKNIWNNWLKNQWTLAFFENHLNRQKTRKSTRNPDKSHKHKKKQNKIDDSSKRELWQEKTLLFGAVFVVSWNINNCLLLFCLLHREKNKRTVLDKNVFWGKKFFKFLKNKHFFFAKKQHF